MDWGIFRPTKPTALLFSLLGVSFLLMTFRLTGAVKNFRTFLLYWASPIQELSTGSVELASEIGGNLIRMVNARQENIQLKKRILDASILETQFKETLEENKRLREMLRLKGTLPFSSMSARVIARDPQNWTQAVWINRGAKDLVAPDSPVLAIDPDGEGGAQAVRGLVGRVLECGHHSSKVLLISDPLSSIAVSIVRTGEQGLAQGQGAYLSLEYLELSSQARPGDEVVSSGLGGIFPGGIPVGILTKVEATPSGFRRGILKPAVSLNRVREILILKMEKVVKE